MSDDGAARNWAGNVAFERARLHRPGSVADIRRLVREARGAGRRVRVLGTGHSFNAIADTPGDQLSLRDLPRRIDVDRERGRVSVPAGLRYGEVTPQLHAAGLALHNLGSLPHINVAGACATGTHGSGEGNGNLATAVAAVELVNADGDVVVLDRDAGPEVAAFPGSVVALGCLGVVTRLELDVRPAFDVVQHVFDGLSHDALLGNLDDVLGAGYSVSVFTRWPDPPVHHVWVKSLADGRPAPDLTPLGAVAADGPRHPVPGMPVDHATRQLGVPGPWHERLPHFRLEFVPSAGDELQSEYFVDRVNGAAALAALADVRDVVSPVLHVSEIRTIAADALWLSEAYGRETLAFHFTWISDAAAVAPAVTAVEAALAPFAPRPHWGKVFTLPPADVRGRYERLPDFAALRARLDPAGMFGNAFTDRYLGLP